MGDYHSAKSSKKFKMGTNGLKISWKRFQQTIQLKTGGGNQMKQKFSVVSFNIFFLYTTRPSSFQNIKKTQFYL